jgi:hypothetical protein
MVMFARLMDSHEARPRGLSSRPEPAQASTSGADVSGFDQEAHRARTRTRCASYRWLLQPTGNLLAAAASGDRPARSIGVADLGFVRQHGSQIHSARAPDSLARLRPFDAHAGPAAA